MKVSELRAILDRFPKDTKIVLKRDTDYVDISQASMRRMIYLGSNVYTPPAENNLDHNFVVVLDYPITAGKHLPKEEKYGQGRH